MVIMILHKICSTVNNLHISNAFLPNIVARNRECGLSEGTFEKGSWLTSSILVVFIFRAANFFFHLGKSDRTETLKKKCKYQTSKNCFKKIFPLLTFSNHS